MASGYERICTDEKLSDAVRRYPCLYNKYQQGYKDKDVVANTWRKLGEELGVEGEKAKRMFENLKKRYSKKRNNLRKVERCGSSTILVVAEQKKLDQLKFLSWLAPYIKERSTKTHFPLRMNDVTLPNSSATFIEVRKFSDEGNAYATSEDDDDVEQINGDEDEIEEDTKAFNKLTTSERLSEIKTPLKKRNPEERNVSATTGKSKRRKDKIVIGTAELDFPKTIEKVVEMPKQGNSTHQTDENHYFGMMIAAGIRKLSPRNQLIARHQLQNVLFDIQIQEQQQPDME